jgi:hypothetical protein
MATEELKVQLSETRFIEVTRFRGKTLISIREYYKDHSGELKPGKKGISLSVSQWTTIIENAEKINDIILMYHV